MASWLLRAQWPRGIHDLSALALRVEDSLTAIAVAFPEASAWTQDDRFDVDALTAQGSVADLVAGVTNASGITRLHLQSGGSYPWLFDLSAGPSSGAPAPDDLPLLPGSPGSPGSPTKPTAGADQLAIHWSDDDALADPDRLAQVLRAVVTIWEPDWASITDMDVVTAAGIFRRGIPLMGWLTYVRGVVTGAHGVDIDLEPFERGTLLKAPVHPSELTPVHVCAAAALVGIMPETT